MDISDWRKRIDEIDRSLVELLNERARCVVEIGKIKQQNALPIQDPNREEEVFRRALQVNGGPLENDALRRVFQQIIEEGRGLEQRLFEANSKTTKESKTE